MRFLVEHPYLLVTLRFHEEFENAAHAVNVWGRRQERDWTVRMAPAHQRSSECVDGLETRRGRTAATVDHDLHAIDMSVEPAHSLDERREDAEQRTIGEADRRPVAGGI